MGGNRDMGRGNEEGKRPGNAGPLLVHTLIHVTSRRWHVNLLNQFFHVTKILFILGSVGPPPTKKHKLYAPRDVSHAEAARYGTLAEFGFFDRVHKAVRSQEVYDNFLRLVHFMITTGILFL